MELLLRFVVEMIPISLRNLLIHLLVGRGVCNQFVGGGIN